MSKSITIMRSTESTSINKFSAIASLPYSFATKAICKRTYTTLDFFNIRQRFMCIKFRVFNLVYNLKIFNPVISLNSVYVMNKLIVSKGSTKMLFHHISMYKDSFSIKVLPKIASTVNNWIKSIEGFLSRFKGLILSPTLSVHTTQSTASFYLNDVFTSIYPTNSPEHLSIISETIEVYKMRKGGK